MATTNSFAALQGKQYIILSTLRKSGAAVKTVVWFAEEGGKLYLYSAANAGKIKRIRNNPQVQLAVSNAKGTIQGEWLDGTARILSGEEATLAKNLINKKYGLQKKFIDLFTLFSSSKLTYMEIVPRE